MSNDINTTVLEQAIESLMGQFAMKYAQPADGVVIDEDDSTTVLNGWTPSVTVAYFTGNTDLFADAVGTLIYEPYTDGAKFWADSIGHLSMDDVWDATGAVGDLGSFKGYYLNGLDLTVSGWAGDFTLTQSWNSKSFLGEAGDVTLNKGYGNDIIIGELDDKLSVTGSDQSISVDFGSFAEIGMGGFKNSLDAFNLVGAEVEGWGVDNHHSVHYGYGMNVSLEGEGTTFDGMHMDGATVDIWGEDILVTSYTGGVSYEDNGHNTTIVDGSGNSVFELDGSGQVLANGGSGNDTFTVTHQGEGVLAGGAGADHFEFNKPAAAEMVVLDFDPTEGDTGLVSFADTEVDLAKFMSVFGKQSDDGSYHAEIGEGALEVFAPNGLDMSADDLMFA